MISKCQTVIFRVREIGRGREQFYVLIGLMRHLQHKFHCAICICLFEPCERYSYSFLSWRWTATFGGYASEDSTMAQPQTARVGYVWDLTRCHIIDHVIENERYGPPHSWSLLLSDSSCSIKWRLQGLLLLNPPFNGFKKGNQFSGIPQWIWWFTTMA